MFGLIKLHKPTGVSSRHAINQIQHRVRPTKVGHAGTLDPLAEGVLVVTLGPATRLTSHIHAWSKAYRGTFLLGRHSDTEDIEGSVIELCDAPIPTREDLEHILPMFTGTISQQPPAHSALKVDGERAYRLARQGRPPQLAARQVTIDRVEIVTYDYPRLELNVVCHTWTYIRSLGRDIARAVGSDAVMSALTSTAVGHLTLDQAVSLEALRELSLDEVLLSPLEALRDLPQVTLTSAQLEAVRHGRTIALNDSCSRELAAVTPQGDLAALLWDQGNHQYRPRRNFVPGFKSPAI